MAETTHRDTDRNISLQPYKVFDFFFFIMLYYTLCCITFFIYSSTHHVSNEAPILLCKNKSRSHFDVKLDC